MLLITDGFLIEHTKNRKKYRLDEFIHKKQYTVADTALTYRQANDLDADNLLNEREHRSSWRKFSFQELVYIQILIELKKFGIKHEQLKELWEAFFKEPVTMHKTALGNKFLGEIAIGCVFGRVEMTLFINDVGNVIFADPIHLPFVLNKESQISIPLNRLVNDLLTKVGKQPIPVETTLQKVSLEHTLLTEKESDLLKIIRNEAYSAIRVTKKDGDVVLAYAEGHKGTNGLSSHDLLKIINEKAFVNISLVRRDGQTIYYKIEETIKL